MKTKTNKQKKPKTKNKAQHCNSAQLKEWSIIEHSLSISFSYVYDKVEGNNQIQSVCLMDELEYRGMCINSVTPQFMESLCQSFLEVFIG